MPMKIILRADVDNLGVLGDEVAVKPGYARNYLIPQGLAMPATGSNRKQFELESKKLQAKADTARGGAEALAAQINDAKVVIEVRVGEGDKLYGSVTAGNIADALAAKGIELDKRKIQLDQPIRSTGAYTIDVRLHPQVRAELNVSVVRLGHTEEAQAEAAPAAEPETQAQGAAE
ncbi:50S ribosomal protein L9 [Desulfocurvibacter africanus]|uniref:50S ribosomal protein L9 n=1 Tax=Desulfocurvibacter africanus TaxID=873 RepID=UPI0004193DAE|nr:50S ribosomal protein L9 [Desulfocurvibacter africanus]